MLKEQAQKLKHDRLKLNDEYIKNPDETYIKNNTALLDGYFITAFDTLELNGSEDERKIRYTIAAIGGYGRSEQCVFSDVDIMFLFDRKIPKGADTLIQKILYPLWDIGLDVGYATRTVDECIQLASQDVEIMTSLLSSRFLRGASSVYNKFKKAFKKRLKTSHNKYVNLIKASNLERHGKFGDSSSLLEPDLKNGKGGLRDFHAMLWIGNIKTAMSHQEMPEKFLNLSAGEYENLTQALNFIRKTRNLLHIIARRKSDHLFFDFHEDVAKALCFEEVDGQKPVERFIGELHEKMGIIKNTHQMFCSENTKPGTKFSVKNLFKKTKTTGLLLTGNLITFDSPETITQTPELLMKIFYESARLNVYIASDAKRIIKKQARLAATPEFRLKTVSMFEDMMNTVSDRYNVINEMLTTGLLFSFIPAFKNIANRIQYNNYHIYPVDRHSINVLREMRCFVNKESQEHTPLYGELYIETEHKRILHWAALLHDIGKGVKGPNHETTGSNLAVKILSEMGLPHDMIETVCFLIENHLFFINAARRRDIDDEETALYCARQIQSTERLKMLYLLTVADSIATGPNAWNSWTESLLKELFFKVYEILGTGRFASQDKEKELADKRSSILSRAPNIKHTTEDLKKTVSGMSNRYMLNHSEEAILDHIKLYETIDTKGFAIQVEKPQETETIIVTLCGNATPGFFSKIAGVFTLNNFNILDAHVYSWGKTTALDIFTIKPFYENTFDSRKPEKIKRDIENALSGSLNLNQELQTKKDHPFYKKKLKIAGAENRVEIDNDSSGFFSIIEVFTYDFPGLLYSVTNHLYENNIDVVYSKITTHVDQVVDIFYVREVNGCKISQAALIEKLKSDILETIENS